MPPALRDRCAADAFRLRMKKEEGMMRMALASFLVLALAACGESPGGRAVSGGLLGAGAGAGVGALTGGNVGTGALI
ncbi:MAG: hypothetical protein AAGC69_17395, partial [Paracraurococcus sp.]